MAKKRIIVDVADARISDNPGEILVTYSLGSCIGVAIYDPVKHIGGMLHYQLPDSKLDTDKAKQRPYMFADTGINCLVKELESLGAEKKRMKVKIAGGANMKTGPQGFDIGKRNYLAVRKIFWTTGIFIHAKDIGGSSPRNMYMDMADGNVTVRSFGLEQCLL